MNKMKVSNKDLIWGYIGIVMSMGINVIILPFILYFLSEDEVGIWYSFSSIGGIATLFDFGFAPTLGRNIAYCWGGARELKKIGTVESADLNGKTNYKLLYKVLCVSKQIYFVISLVALLVLLGGGSVYVKYITRNDFKVQYMVAWIIYSLALFLNLLYGYCTSYLTGIGAVAEYNKSLTYSRIIQIIVLVVTLGLGGGLIGASLAYGSYGVSFRLISLKKFYQQKEIKENLKLHKDQIDFKEKKEMFLVIWHNAWRDGIVSLANFLTSQATTVLCSLFYSLAETGIYGVCMQIINAICGIATNVYSIHQPSLQEAAIKKDTRRQRDIMSLAMTSYLILFFLMIALVIWIAIPILHIIKPTTKIEINMLLALCIYALVNKRQQVYASYISNSNNLPYVKAYIVSGVLAIIVAIVFVYSTNLGIWGLILAQIITQFSYNGWCWPRVVHKELNTNSIEMLKNGFNQIMVKIKRYFKF